MKTETKIQTILSALRAFALSAAFAVALIALAPAAFAETKTESDAKRRLGATKNNVESPRPKTENAKHERKNP